MAHRIQLVTVGALLVSACGLDLVGAFNPDASVVDPADAMSDGTIAVDGATPPPASCTVTCPSATLSAAAFTLVGFGDAKDPCPDGFDSADRFEDPKPKAGSCSCGACTTTGSACTGNSIELHSSDGAGVCDITSSTRTLTSGQCTAFSSYWIYNYASPTAPPPSALGTCKTPGVTDRTMVGVGAVHICSRKSDTCADSMCSLPGSLKACLRASGDVACPSAAMTKHLVGTDISLACAACKCTPTATCTGSLSYWTTSSTCSGTEHTIPAGACTKVDKQDIAAFKWTGTVASEGCTNVSAAGPATASLKDVETVCCP